jgi:hypothetical protein
MLCGTHSCCKGKDGASFSCKSGSSVLDWVLLFDRGGRAAPNCQIAEKVEFHLKLAARIVFLTQEQWGGLAITLAVWSRLRVIKRPLGLIIERLFCSPS